MPRLSQDITNITLEKQNTNITFNTAGTYCDNDIKLNLNIKEAELSHTCKITPTVELTSSKFYFSEEDNNLDIDVTTTTTSEYSFSVNPGFISNDFQFSDSKSETIKKYISGVSISKPDEGVNSFFIEFPDQSKVFHFSIDSNGNITVE